MTTPINQEIAIQSKVDQVIRRYKTTDITYYPYTSGSVDRYKQRHKTFGSSTILVGRAIHNPTPQQITIIGDGEEYDIAFLFSRTELENKLPGSAEGDWIDVRGEMEWRSRRYKIEQVRPTGQIGLWFHIVAVLAKSIEGQRDP